MNYNAQPITVENLLVNASLLKEHNKGNYSKVGTDELDLYFDGSTPNKYYLENVFNNILPDTVKGQVIFSNRIFITNYQRYDTLFVADTNGFTVNWSGGNPNGKVQIRLMKNDDEENSDITKPSGFASFVVDNSDGFYHFTSNELQKLGTKNVFYDMTIESYEPIFDTLANGKNICLLGVSAYQTTVYVKQ